MRHILHCDANNFFASVAQISDPSLANKAVAVSGNPFERTGIILAKNELAKSYGVKTGEVIWSAQNKCPNLVLVPPKYDDYVKYSKLLFKIYSQYTPYVQSFGIDECWLDVTSTQKIFKGPLNIAKEILKRTKNELGLTVSIGVSFSKIFSKLGSDYKKPNAITEINKNNYKNVVWPLDVSRLLMIGPKINKKLNSLSINTIGNLACADKNLLKRYFGINGIKLINFANGIDEDPRVQQYNHEHIPKSLGHSTTLRYDISSYDEILSVIYALSQMLSYRLNNYNLIAGGVSVSIKYSNFETLNKQKKINTSLNNADAIAKTSFNILKEIHHINERKRIRSLGISLYNLQNSNIKKQMTLFDFNQTEDENSSRKKIDNVLQEVRSKYGYNSINYAITNKHKKLCSKLIPTDFISFAKISLKDDAIKF